MKIIDYEEEYEYVLVGNNGADLYEGMSMVHERR